MDTLKTNDAQLVKRTWASLVPYRDDVAMVFYQNLFTRSPQIRELFNSTDMQSQRDKFLDMIDGAIASLDNVSLIAQDVRELGRRHTSYGVEPAHYSFVGKVLLDSLGEALGDAFTPEVEAAWAKAYTLLSEIMQDEPRQVA